MAKLDPRAEKARAYAFLLLKYRPRSAHEIVQRLQRKRFSEAVITGTVGFLKEKKFIDDAAFAQAWVRSRAGKRFGPRRVKQELRIKGVDPSIIKENVAELQQTYREENTVAQLAQERALRLRGIAAQIAKRRIYAYLVRRGFSPDESIDALNGLFE